MAFTEANAQDALFALKLQGYTFHSSFIFQDFCDALKADGRNELTSRRRFGLDHFDIAPVEHESGPELFFFGAASLLVVEKLVQLLGNLLRTYVAAIKRQNQRYPTEHDAKTIEVLLKTAGGATIRASSIRKISSTEYVLDINQEDETLGLAVESLVRRVSGAAPSQGRESDGRSPRFASSNIDWIFLCHASEDKDRVRVLYRNLKSTGYSPWLDEQDLLPGCDWEHEIKAALRNSRVTLVCLSLQSISKVGFVHREIRYTVAKAEEMPDGHLFILPVRFEPCELPSSLHRYQSADLWSDAGYERLLSSLEAAGVTRRNSESAPAPKDRSSLRSFTHKQH